MMTALETYICVLPWLTIVGLVLTLNQCEIMLPHALLSTLAV